MRYVIENIRPRRTLTVFGTVLASANTPGRSRMPVTYEQLFDPLLVRLFKASRIRLVEGEMPPELVALIEAEVPGSGEDLAEPGPTLVPESVEPALPTLPPESATPVPFEREEAPPLEEVEELPRSVVRSAAAPEPVLTERRGTLVVDELAPEVPSQETPSSETPDSEPTASQTVVPPATTESTESPADSPDEEEEPTERTEAVTYTAESLKALTVKRLRKLCKDMSLKSSGTEDELVARILEKQGGGS